MAKTGGRGSLLGVLLLVAMILSKDRGIFRQERVGHKGLSGFQNRGAEDCLSM
jgi:hypothetical protein